MSISFDKVLGVHEQALNLRTRRAEVLAANLVNADTPGYKARDIDFQSILSTQLVNAVPKPQLRGTDPRHIAPSSASAFSPELMYRTPLQPSADGNTVEEQVEMAKYTQNSMDLAATLHFVNAKIKGMKAAIKGGQS